MHHMTHDERGESVYPRQSPRVACGSAGASGGLGQVQVRTGHMKTEDARNSLLGMHRVWQVASVRKVEWPQLASVRWLCL